MKNGKDPGLESVPASRLNEALAAGATVVTATRRLARKVEADYAASRNAASWPTPDVLHWSAWLARSYRAIRDFGAGIEPRPLLGEAQAAVLWEAVLSDDPEGRELLMPAGAAAQCREAWDLVHDWEIPEEILARRGNEDCRRFAALASAYRQRVREAGFADSAGVAAQVARRAGELGEQPVLFHGFERLSPARQRVMSALGDRGIQVAPATVARPGGPGVVACPDPETELVAAVAWARRQLEARSDARIGLVVPDLGARRGFLEQLLDEVLSPARLWPGSLDGARPWNISLGAPLPDAPVAAAALGALSAGAASMSSTEAGRLLRCRFLGEADSEAASRAALDAWLRERVGDTVPAGRLAGWARRAPGFAASPAFAKRLSGLLDVLWGAPRRRAPSAWAEAFSRALHAVGWPGEAPLDSVEYQGTAAWAELLDGFAGLDAVLGAVGLDEALARLRRMAAERLFQPESGEVPVQVMGLLETPGQTFDALWVTGLHDGVLPAPLEPCPFIPVSVQRERRMPRACAETELALARAWVARIGNAAGEVVMSWPHRQDDEPLRPSPVLYHLPEASAGPQGVVTAAAMQLETAALETIDDARGEAAEGALKGGTGLLKSQSACPFQAYARYRLKCDPMDAPAPGVDPLTRGGLLHDALRRFWEETRDQSTLAGMDPADRRRRVRSAVETAMADVQAAREVPLPPVLAGIEIDQAVARMEELLDQELGRTAFTVSRLEDRVELRAGPLRLNGRVDRVDEVPDGHVVIDYKTGDGRRGDWAGPRPREPQLPLYAVNLPDVVGVAFGCLKPGAVGYRGLARDADAMGVVGPAKKDHGAREWAAALDEWRETLDQLGRGVAEGDARVAPRDGDRTCEFCGLQTLCRRDELAARGALPDE